MRLRNSAIAVPAVALVVLAIVSCGGSHRSAAGADKDLSSARHSGGPPPQGRLAPDYDTDDYNLLKSGRKAPMHGSLAIDAIVKSYYAAAGRGDGATACRITAPGLARAAPEDYGQDMGAAIPPAAERYLRGASTCAAVLSLLFEHEHGELAAPVQVTGIRLEGDHGFAVVGSTTLPASRIEVAREGAAWRIDELLGRALP